MSEFAENRKILYVDDEESILLSFRSLMRNQNLEVHTLNDPLLVSEYLATHGPFAAVLSDERMPGADGVAVLSGVKERFPDTMRVLVTGYADIEAIQQAINLGGIMNYVSKPWDDANLRSLVQELVSRYNAVKERHYLLDEIKLKNETLELLLEGTIGGVVKLLSDVVASIGEDVAAQNVRIKSLGNAIIKQMPDLTEKETWNIRRSLELFNLGLALLPPLVQMRVGREGLRATNDIPLAAKHNVLAADLLSGIPQFEEVARIIRLQRKNFDGTGDPVADSVRGKDIPLGSRILKILLDMEMKSTDHFKGRDVLQKMNTMHKVYDADLLQILLGGKPTPDARKPDAKVPVRRLSVGMVLLEDLVTQNGQLLLRRNATLTETVCKLLSQWGNIDPIVSPVHVLLDQGGEAD